MIHQLFRRSLASKLQDVHAYCKKYYSVGNEINFVISNSKDGKFSFSASIITSCAQLGDISGKYTFFTSRKFNDIDIVLNELTREVAIAANKFPEKTFIRHYDSEKYFSKGSWVSAEKQKHEHLNLIEQRIVRE